MITLRLPNSGGELYQLEEFEYFYTRGRKEQDTSDLQVFLWKGSVSVCTDRGFDVGMHEVEGREKDVNFENRVSYSACFEQVAAVVVGLLDFR